tara:strand:+ start:751 stop:987 length:237 start_codon:yes stop_codon:yes gene_type:complete
MKNSSSYADKITRQDMKEAVDFLNSFGMGTFTFYEGNNEYIHRIKDEHSNTILIGNTKRELYGKIQAFIRGMHYRKNN